jgi:hypothetical protein
MEFSRPLDAYSIVVPPGAQARAVRPLTIADVRSISFSGGAYKGMQRAADVGAMPEDMSAVVPQENEAVPAIFYPIAYASMAALAIALVALALSFVPSVQGPAKSVGAVSLAIALLCGANAAEIARKYGKKG